MGSYSRLLSFNCCSNAFETKISDRAHVWAQIPDNLDILMTHVPPGHDFGGPASDPLLTKQLMKSTMVPPRVHVYGHDHSRFGAWDGPRGIRCLNGAQEKLLRIDPQGGGLAWVFDLQAPGLDD